MGRDTPPGTDSPSLPDLPPPRNIGWEDLFVPVILLLVVGLSVMFVARSYHKVEEPHQLRDERCWFKPQGWICVSKSGEYLCYRTRDSFRCLPEERT